METVKKSNAILQYLEALKNLKDLNIIKNQKDFTSQLGEWLIAELYNGEIAINGKQAYWDIKKDGKHYQVKSHAKSKTTNRSNTDFRYDENAEIDFFIIVIFSDVYKLTAIYEIPFCEALKLKTIENKDPVIRWKDAKDYIIDYKSKFSNNRVLDIF
jgi:hypothetical protein